MIGLQPDLILDYGSIRSTYVSLADRTQAQTGIPYVLIDGRFDNTPTALRLLGDIFGVPERAEALARHTESLFSQLDAVLAEVPEEDRPRVYLARGPEGLETGVAGSINTEIIERAGGLNVADYGPELARQRNLVSMTIEAVLDLNPDMILTGDHQFYDQVYSNPLWAPVRAVQNKNVYFAPSVPFGWIDRPPSINRLIGLKWLTGLFYPDRFQLDLATEVRDFYRLFYQVEISDSDLAQWIAWSRD